MEVSVKSRFNFEQIAFEMSTKQLLIRGWTPEKNGFRVILGELGAFL